MNTVDITTSRRACMTHATMEPKVPQPLASCRTRLADDALIAFDSRSAGLGEGDATWIRRWVMQWLSDAPAAIVLVGCVGLRQRAARKRALRQVCDALVGCGVSDEHIRCIDVPLRGPDSSGLRTGPETASRGAAAWLKVVAAQDADHGAHSIRSHFEPTMEQENFACTSAS